MKRFLFILAVAASVVAACSITSCKKATNPLLGTWLNVSATGGGLRTIKYTFTETGVNTYTFIDAAMVGGNGGTYTYSAPNVTINLTQPSRTETGSLNGEELTISTSSGELTFGKLEE